MAIIEGTRALVFNLEGKHELHNTVVYVECLLHDAIDPEERVFGVVGGYFSFEYHLPAMYLIPLDDRDDHTIESYTDWESY